MKKNSGSPVAFYTMGIAVLFLAGFFLLVVFGAQTYRSVAAGQDQNNRSRALLSYLSTCVKAVDGRVEIRICGSDLFGRGQTDGGVRFCRGGAGSLGGP